MVGGNIEARTRVLVALIGCLLDLRKNYCAMIFFEEWMILLWTIFYGQILIGKAGRG